MDTYTSIKIFLSKEVKSGEFGLLMEAVGWGDASTYTNNIVSQSLGAYPFVAHARDKNGVLVGYVSAFSDGAFSTFVGELVVHPSVQRQGVGRLLIDAVEKYSGEVPIYVKPFTDVERFFLKQGYRKAPRPASVLYKKARVAA